MRRVLAYIFDVTAVYFIIMAISVSPLNPNYEKGVDLQNEYNEKYQAFIDETADQSIDDEEYENKFNEFSDYSLDVLYNESKLNIYDDIYTTVLMILYFAVFAYFFGGETVGKRLLKIKVVDKNGNKPKFWQLLVRTVVLFGLPLSLLSSILSYAIGKNAFFYASAGINLVNMILSIAILITFFANKEHLGLHDMIAKTKVVKR